MSFHFLFSRILSRARRRLPPRLSPSEAGVTGRGRRFRCSSAKRKSTAFYKSYNRRADQRKQEHFLLAVSHARLSALPLNLSTSAADIQTTSQPLPLSRPAPRGMPLFGDRIFPPSPERERKREKRERDGERAPRRRRRKKTLVLFFFRLSKGTPCARSSFSFLRLPCLF